MQLRDTYNQVDIVNLRIWFANQILNMSREVEELALADVAATESKRPEYGNLSEYYDVIRFGPLLKTVTENVDYYPFAVQVKELYLITIKPVIMSLEAFEQNIVVPEIIVKHEMKKSNCSYKEASSNLYAGDLPTVYHEKILLHVKDALNLYSRRPAYLNN